MLGDTVLAAAVAATYVHSVRDWDKANINREFMTGARPNSQQKENRLRNVPTPSPLRPPVLRPLARVRTVMNML